MVAAYALLSVVLGAISIALLWSWSPLLAILSAPVVASTGVLALAAIIVFLPQPSEPSREPRILPAE